MVRDYEEDVNDNYQRAFSGLAADLPDGELNEFGPLTAVASGLDVRLFNRIFAFQAPASEELAAAVRWLTERDLPFRVTSTDAAVGKIESLAHDVELVRSEESTPGMVRPSLAEVPALTSDVDIIEVRTVEELNAFVTVVAAVFGMPVAVTDQVYQTAVHADRDRLFVGRVDGEAAACGLLIRTGDVAGVYTIGVREPYRRRGLGESMTQAVLRAGREAGCRIGVLQSSEMAVPLYEQMDFKPAVTYHHFEPIS